MNGAEKNVKIGLGLLGAAVALMLGWIIARIAVGWYVDALWFKSVGYQDVFWTILSARLVIGGVVFLMAATALLVTLRTAFRRAPFRGYFGGGSLDLDPVRVDRAVRTGLPVAAVFAAGLLGISAAHHWLVFLNYRYAEPFAMTDPVFGHDAGYYVFCLPAIAYALKMALLLTCLCLAAATAVYYARGAIAFRDERRAVQPGAFAHLSILGSAALALFAGRFWVARYQLLLRGNGVAFGAGYTDIHARKGAYVVLFALTLLLAAWVFLNAFLKKRPANIYAGATYALLWLIIGMVYPWGVENFVVRPNQWEREAEYIRRSIEHTRFAYRLDGVQSRSWPGDGIITKEVLAAHPGTLDNLLLWDSTPLRDLYNQKQRIRAYYDFGDPDMDRYLLDGRLRPVMLGVRELAPAQLGEVARVWTNLHLQYTHGYGLCMTLANRVTPGGLPEFLIHNIPPESTSDLAVTQPRIYYGEQTGLYALINTRLDEFDYPGDPANFSNRYDGGGGIPVGGMLRRAVLSWYTGDRDILFTKQFTKESRILLFRHIRQRAAKIAPFFFFDEDPYPVLHDGRLIWVLDGYTLTNRFPYSEPLGIANYWRNAVKTTIDAYDGTVAFYCADGADPILKVFQKIFPTLLKPIDDMPAGLRNHMRYPKDMFRVQTTVYCRYHVEDPKVFYNAEDVWTFPRGNEEKAASYEPPRYLVMELPGVSEDKGLQPLARVRQGTAAPRRTEEYVLTRSFTVEGKDNMVAWMAGRCDPEHYGELVLYRLPKRQNIYGPNQMKGRFNQDPEVSAFMTLMGQLGSTVQQSKVLAVPIENALLYLQSLFVVDPNVKIPELKQVVAGHGDRVAMAPTIEQALDKLFAEPPAATAAQEPTSEPRSLPSAGERLDVEEDTYVSLRELYRQAQDCLKTGDWKGFGAAFDALGEKLKVAPGLNNTDSQRK